MKENINILLSVTSILVTCYIAKKTFRISNENEKATKEFNEINKKLIDISNKLVNRSIILNYKIADVTSDVANGNDDENFQESALKLNSGVQSSRGTTIMMNINIVSSFGAIIGVYSVFFEKGNLNVKEERFYERKNLEFENLPKNVNVSLKKEWLIFDKNKSSNEKKEKYIQGHFFLIAIDSTYKIHKILIEFISEITQNNVLTEDGRLVFTRNKRMIKGSERYELPKKLLYYRMLDEFDLITYPNYPIYNNNTRWNSNNNELENEEMKENYTTLSSNDLKDKIEMINKRFGDLGFYI